MIKRTQAVEDRFIELRAGGAPYSDIARELDVSKQTLIEWSKVLRVKLANACAIRQDEVVAKLTAASKARIESFSSRLHAIMGELEGRDLREVPTRDLFTLAMKLDDHLKGEVRTPIFRAPGDWTELPQEPDETWPA